MANVDGYGAAKPKSGDNRKALSRAAGYQATMKACENKVRSPYKGSEKHNQWEGKGDNSSNDNLKGYGEGGGGGY
jgi:hypothetical protein